MQLSLTSAAPPRLDHRFARLRRITLDAGSWLAHQPGWLQGDAALFSRLERTTRWRSLSRPMYDRWVDVPRLVARLPDDGPGDPLLDIAAALLGRRFGRRLGSVSMNLYRDGRDSVAMHGDRLGDRVGDAIVAIVSLGAPRAFRVRPVGGGAGTDLQLGWGDLLVMGGACQRDWRHGVPKARRVAGPRLSIMFREGQAPVDSLRSDRSTDARARPPGYLPADGGDLRPRRPD